MERTSTSHMESFQTLMLPWRNGILKPIITITIVISVNKGRDATNTNRYNGSTVWREIFGGKKLTVLFMKCLSTYSSLVALPLIFKLDSFGYFAFQKFLLYNMLAGVQTQPVPQLVQSSVQKVGCGSHICPTVTGLVGWTDVWIFACFYDHRYVGNITTSGVIVCVLP